MNVTYTDVLVNFLLWAEENKDIIGPVFDELLLKIGHEDAERWPELFGVPYVADVYISQDWMDEVRHQADDVLRQYDGEFSPVATWVLNVLAGQSEFQEEV